MALKNKLTYHLHFEMKIRKAKLQTNNMSKCYCNLIPNVEKKSGNWWENSKMKFYGKVRNMWMR